MLYIADDGCARPFCWQEEIICFLSRPISLNFLKICACCLPHLLLQHEQGQGSCDYQNNTLRPLTRDMDVWRSDPFGSLRNSKAIPTGLAWIKSSRSAV